MQIEMEEAEREGEAVLAQCYMLQGERQRREDMEVTEEQREANARALDPLGWVEAAHVYFRNVVEANRQAIQNTPEGVRECFENPEFTPWAAETQLDQLKEIIAVEGYNIKDIEENIVALEYYGKIEEWVQAFPRDEEEFERWAQAMPAPPM